MKDAFYGVWVVVGLLLSCTLGTLLAHVFLYGWFIPKGG